ncbi:hypothetical protein [Geobacter sp.]|uniref:hypothetical protein n=1 Tax=Geobacter sp. TaxID=46610 RepID=UPI00263451B0|nr:hypothetical protein [Geobacter sp.]
MSLPAFPPLDNGIPPIAFSGIGMEDLLLTLFAGLGTMAVTIQLLPGLMLFGSMMRSLFGAPDYVVQPGNGADRPPN